MIISITYKVNQALYHSSNVTHDITLITTEYQYGNELLVHLQIGKNLNIRLNNCLDALLPQGIQKEQFLFKKKYNPGDTKLITRSTFNAKISQFVTRQTAIKREILEEYAYTNMYGLPDRVHIVMTHREDTTVATIDFEDVKQYKSFIYPEWLVRQEADEYMPMVPTPQ